MITNCIHMPRRISTFSAALILSLSLMDAASLTGCSALTAVDPSEVGITDASSSALKAPIMHVNFPASKRPAKPSPSRDGDSKKAAATDGEDHTVVASHYGRGLNGKKTASGERFDAGDRTAAHRTLPLGSKVEVKNPETGQKTEVVINDRGPYAKGRQLDLSEKAAKDVGVADDGTAKVQMRVVERGDNSTKESRDR